MLCPRYMDVCGANTRCATLEGGESGALENRVKLGCSQATTGLKLGYNRAETRLQPG